MMGSIEDVGRVRREILALIVLSLLAISVFLGTRLIAKWEEQRSLADAAAWYARGMSHVDSHQNEEAVTALRRAYAKNRTSRQYAIALAHALSASGLSDDATRVLLTLRDATPEDPEINLELARLSAMRGDLTEAIRYYHSALYGVWPTGRESARADVRVELVRLLLDNDRRRPAVAELIALTSNLPDTSADHAQAGRLLLEASEPRLALDQFRRVLGTDAKDVTALAGAGEASFQLGDYVGARQYFHDAQVLPPRLTTMRDVAEQVITRDPLAPRLAASERHRRVVDLLGQLRERIDTCRSRPQPLAPDTAARLDIADAELQDVDMQLHGAQRPGAR